MTNARPVLIKTIAICLSFLGIIALSATGTEASIPQQTGLTSDVAGPWMPGSINSGIKTNDAYTDGSFSIVAPVWSSIGSGSTLEGGLLYVEPYISWGEGGEVASSLGMGWRYLFSDQSVSALTDHDREHDKRQAGFFEEGWAIGASLFLDMLDTQSNQQFWQLGTGVELMSRYVELRGNYYLPLTGKKETGSFRTRETSTTTQSSTSYTTQTTTTDPYATGYTIAQDINQSVIATTQTRTTTTTIERLFRQYEEGLQGWDAELAVLMPWIDRWMDVKLIGGYYHFDNQPFGPQALGTGKVEGWKAGVEVRPVPALALSASWYQDEKLTGSDWIAGFRIELPFETTNIGDGKGGFWGHIKDAFKPRRRHFAERLAEPVHRQNAAVKLGGVTEEKKSAAATTSSLQTVTRVVSQSSTHVELAIDVVFVDNSIGAPGNPGTYEAPLDTIQGGENTANGLFGDNGKVFVQGGGLSYVEQVVVDRSTAFYGSGRGITFSNGATFRGRTADSPVLMGSIFAERIEALSVSGFTIWPVTSFGSRSQGGITAFQVRNVAIVGNTFVNWVASGPTMGSTAQTGIRYWALGSGKYSLLIAENTFVRPMSGSPAWYDCISIEASSFANDATLEFDLRSNQFSAGTSGININIVGTPAIGSITQNVFSNGNNTINCSVDGDLALRISENDIVVGAVGSSLNAVGIKLAGLGGTQNVTIDGNKVSILQYGDVGVQVNQTGGDFRVYGTQSNTFAAPNSGTHHYEVSGKSTGSFIINNTIVNAAFPFP